MKKQVQVVVVLTRVERGILQLLARIAKKK